MAMVALLQVHGSAVVGASSSSSSFPNKPAHLHLSSSDGAAAAVMACQPLASWTTDAQRTVRLQTFGISPVGRARSLSSARMEMINDAETARRARKCILEEEEL